MSFKKNTFICNGQNECLLMIPRFNGLWCASFMQGIALQQILWKLALNFDY